MLVRRRRDGAVGDVTPPPFNVRSRVHEYGGGAFASRAAGARSSSSTSRIRRSIGSDPGRRRLTAVPPRRRPQLAVRRPGVRPRPAAPPGGRRATRCRASGAGKRRWWPSIATQRRDRGAGPRRRFLRPPHPQRGRRTGWPGCPGTTPTCPGTRPPCRWPSSIAGGPPGRPGHVAGDARAPPSSRPSGPTGAIFSVGAARFWNLWRDAAGGGTGAVAPARRPSWACRSGGSASPAGASSTRHRAGRRSDAGTAPACWP